MISATNSHRQVPCTTGDGPQARNKPVQGHPSGLRSKWLLEVIPFSRLSKKDAPLTGGKSANLGEMLRELGKLTSAGLNVPDGFSTTTLAFHQFLEGNELKSKLYKRLEGVDVNDSHAVETASRENRALIMHAPFSASFIKAVSVEVNRLNRAGIKSLAVRSSATAEDGIKDSFAGMHDSILNVPNNLDAVLFAIKQVMASVFEPRAITYRVKKGYRHEQVVMCVCVQRLVRSDLDSAGVMLTAHTQSGHTGIMVINPAYGLGESAVGGNNTDQYLVGKPTVEHGVFSVLSRRIGEMDSKVVLLPRESDGGKNGLGSYTSRVPLTEGERTRFCLDDKRLLATARAGLIIEKHFKKPMDIEFAWDGETGKLCIVQARPITSLNTSRHMEVFALKEGDYVKITSGMAITGKIVTGKVVVLKSADEVEDFAAELDRVQAGDILVTQMTTPDCESAIGRAAGMITQEGSAVCHAALVAAEYQIPTLVGCSGVLAKVKDGDIVTICCAEGIEGSLYEGTIPFTVTKIKIGKMPKLPVEVKAIVGNPGLAPVNSRLPNNGAGLVRMELILAKIGIHPRLIIDYDMLDPNDPEDMKLKAKIDERIRGYESPMAFFESVLSESLAMFARSFDPERILVRLSDLKTNEYRKLLGGDRRDKNGRFMYEPEEENPMMGWRGAARYLDPRYLPCFLMELRALKIVRNKMGLTNVDIMVPFVRTVTEIKKVRQLLDRNGLRSSDTLKIYMMCELPVNAALADEFLKYVDGFSIGGNDMTQLAGGTDRDGGSQYITANDEGVWYFVRLAIEACKRAGKPCGYCGEPPSLYPGYAQRLMDMGITSISLNVGKIFPVTQKLRRHYLRQR